MPGHLRREELKFTGTWERLEFPLAIATMLIATLLGVINIFQHRELTSYEQYGARWYLQSVNSHVFGDLKKGKRGYLYPVPDASEDAFLAGFQARFEGAESNWEGDDYDALARLADHLGRANRDLEKSLGTLTDFTQPQSAFTAATLVLSVLDENMNKWRPSLRRIQAVYQPSRSNKQDDSVKVTLDLVFFAEDTVEASRHYEAFLAEISGQPWHIEHQERSSKDLANGRASSSRACPSPSTSRPGSRPMRAEERTNERLPERLQLVAGDDCRLRHRLDRPGHARPGESGQGHHGADAPRPR